MKAGEVDDRRNGRRPPATELGGLSKRSGVGVEPSPPADPQVNDPPIESTRLDFT